MAAPSYTEDLTDITLAETTTGWSALGGGASGLSASPDIAMQGTNCVDKQITNAEKGQVFDNGSGVTIGSGRHVYTWLFMSTPGLTDTLALRGLTVVIGSSTSNYCSYHVEGNNTYGAGGRVGKCYVVDPSVFSSNTGSSPYRTQTGTPSGTYQVFGGTANITASVKGANLGVDAIRHGTGGFVTAGESGNPGTFAGFASSNDSSTNRWGILTSVGGSYELQGRFHIGQNNTGTPTLAYFSDSNVNLVIPDAVHAASTFNQIIVDHASTTCILTNVSIQALGTTAPGQFIVNSNNPTVTITGGTWSNIGTTTLRSNTTVDGLAWRICGQITVNSATIQNSIIANSSASSAVIATNLEDLDNCTFVSDGTGHAVELTSLGTGSMDWNCTDTNYAGSDGSTGNETIYVNVGSGSLTINVQAGATTPTIRTAGASVNVVSGTVSVSVKTVTVGGTAIASANVFLYANTGGPMPYQDSVTITRSGSTATVSHTAHGLATNDYIWIEGANEGEYNGVYLITKINNDSYSYTVSGTPATPATGTIIATFVLLKGLTNGTGDISMSRSFPSTQPVVGWARKSTSSPFYKTGTITGSVSTSTGFSATVPMISDE